MCDTGTQRATNRVGGHVKLKRGTNIPPRYFMGLYGGLFSSGVFSTPWCGKTYTRVLKAHLGILKRIRVYTTGVYKHL